MAMESIISEISLDIYDHDRTQPTLKAICGDSLIRYVRATLYLSGRAYTINDENAIIKLNALRPDRTLVIGNASCVVETHTLSPEYTPIEETYSDDPIVSYYYLNENNKQVYVDDPADVPVGYTVYEEAVSGEIHTRYYYIDEDGNRIDVDGPEVIPAVFEQTYKLYAELSKEMLAVTGIVQMQFKITCGDQVLKTSKFRVDVGESLERNVAGTIDLTAQ